jgi:hypothetical protein
MRGKWVEVDRLRGGEPLWVWLTRQGLDRVDLPYSYRNMENSLDALKHLYAINDIRLEWEEGAIWVSERRLLHEVVRMRGVDLLHRPDAELFFPDGTSIAMEAELSMKRPEMLAENLMELVRGEGYLQLKAEYGKCEARERSREMESKYSDIWYFGGDQVRSQVLRERARLVEEGAMSHEEAKRIYVKWYPLAMTTEDEDQEEQENTQRWNRKNKKRRRN